MSVPPSAAPRFAASIAPTLADFACAYGEIARWIEYATTDTELGLGERRILGAICSIPQRAADLSSSLRMDSGQVTKLCNALRDRGLIELQPGAEGKKRVYSATASGRLLTSKVVARQQQAAAHVWNNSSSFQRARLCTAAGKLADLFPKQTQPTELRPIATGDLAMMIQDALPTYSGPQYSYDSHELEHYLHDKANDFLSAPKHRCVGFVIEHNSRIPGCILAIPYNDSTLRIILHSVAIPYRGVGHGKQLLLAVEKEAARIGYKFLEHEGPGKAKYPIFEYLGRVGGWKHLGGQQALLCKQGRIIDCWQKTLGV